MLGVSGAGGAARRNMACLDGLASGVWCRGDIPSAAVTEPSRRRRRPPIAAYGDPAWKGRVGGPRSSASAGRRPAGRPGRSVVRALPTRTDGASAAAPVTAAAVSQGVWSVAGPLCPSGDQRSQPSVEPPPPAGPLALCVYVCH